LNGKHYVPQNRERIIIVGFKKSVFKQKENFEFPDPQESHFIIRDILERKVDDKYTLSDKLWSYLQEHARKHKAKGNGFGFGMTDLNGISRTISARYYKDGSEVLIFNLGDTQKGRAIRFNLFFVPQKRISTSIPIANAA
jgi:DNA (cytosine-5)-methyltransferase 1